MVPCDGATRSCALAGPTPIVGRSSAEILERMLHTALPQHPLESYSVSPSPLPVCEVPRRGNARNATCPERPSLCCNLLHSDPNLKPLQAAVGQGGLCYAA